MFDKLLKDIIASFISQSDNTSLPLKINLFIHIYVFDLHLFKIFIIQ